MSDGFDFDLDVSGALAALDRVATTMEKYTVPASKITADNIAREAKNRVARATGATAEGIRVVPMNNGRGYIVLSTRQQQYDLPLWLEKGVRQGKPRSHTAAARPYFYVSGDLEVGAHERRILDALAQAAAEEGLAG